MASHATDAPGQSYPDVDQSAPSNGSAGLNGSTLHNVKDSAVESKLQSLLISEPSQPFRSPSTAASSTMASIQNHPTTQNVKSSIADGPVGQSVKNQKDKTTSEFQDLANSRKTPDQPAATGQPLTHYHSMFYRLLSWKNPRATGIAFLMSVLFIFAARYLNVVRYTFKVLYMVMGATAIMELIGKMVMGNGLATQMRPRQYYVIPKDSLERLLDDVEQLINFFVIEFQRVVFVENIWVTAAAFVSSFMSYWLIKIVPLWGLALIFDNVIFLSPLIYKSNKEFIDAHLSHAGNVLNAQANQMKDMASQHTSRATTQIRSYAGEYSQKARGMMGNIGNRQPGSTVRSTDFPNAPQSEPQGHAPTHAAPEPQLAQ